MEIEPSFMVGSCHRHANGYGYGTRAPTERNNPGIPSIPKYKIHPDHGGIVTGSRSMALNVTGDSADRRHAFQLAQQTSGDYGKFLYPTDTRITRATYSTMQLANKSSSSFARPFTSSNTIPAAGTSTSNQLSMESTRVVSRPHSETRSARQANTNTTSTTPIQRGLPTLDPRLPSHCKFDLLAATCTSKPPELGWSIQSNVLAHNKSIDWRNSLRHPKRAVTPGPGNSNT